MAIEKRTVIDQIEVRRNGMIQLRLGMLLVEDGVTLDCKWLRTSIEPGLDIDEVIAHVNAYLTAKGRAAVESADVERLKTIAGGVHTDQVVTSFRAAKEAAQEIAKQQNVAREGGSKS